MTKDNLIPIVFGITGHRDLRPEDFPKLEERIRKVFLDIRADLAKKKDRNENQGGVTPFILLSPLAEGADRLAAKVALELGWIDLIVPLPMDKEEYMNDFSSKESQAEFEALVKRARASFVLPLMEVNQPEDHITNLSIRDKQYEQVGAYVAKCSQILIALWDGVEKENSCGTSNTVKFKLEGDPRASLSILEPLDRGPVYHILTPRKSRNLLSDEKFTLKILYPKEHTDREKRHEKFMQELKKVNSYNLDVVKVLSTNKMQDQVRNNKFSIISKQSLRALHNNPEYSGAATSIEALLEHCAVADTLSGFFSKRRKVSIIILSVLTMISVMLFAINKNSTNVIDLMLYPLSVLFAYAIYFVVDFFSFQDKHQDHRALAEGLRVQLFWKIAGLDVDVSDYYLKKHKSHLEWIRNAIRVLNIHQGNEKVNQPDFKMVWKCWIKSDDHNFRGQLDYFALKTKLYAEKVTLYDRLAKIITRSVFFIVILILVFHCFYIPKDELGIIQRYLIILTALLSPIAALLATFVGKMSYKELSSTYERMEELFRMASNKLEENLTKGDTEKVKEIIFELGKEALNENGDWVMINRDKGVDRPIK